MLVDAAVRPEEFPPDFVWGAATASYQIEGAATLGGRTPSIWDTFCAEPGRVVGGDTGDVACDHYHRYGEDVGLMRTLGLAAYRFSVSWSRVLTPSGEVNADGLGFYDRLVDEVLAAGIDPWVTLYHWDLPQHLEDAGGWPARDTAARLAELAAVVGGRLGDRVGHFITLNEPWCAAFLGYGNGIHAPGRHSAADAVAASHHLNLAHGLSVQALRAAAPDALVGTTLNLYPVTAAFPGADSEDAVRRIDGLQNRWFLDPALLGSYPDDVLADLGALVAPTLIQDGDLGTIHQPLDFLGINYYTRHVVRPSAYPGTNAGEFTHRGLPTAANGWEVDPEGLTEILVRVARDYPALPLFITENGSAWDDTVEADGSVVDADRLAYLAAHLAACARAREQGADVAGYFAWSLLDNFEWAEGYAMRFGLVHVDFATQRRTVKASGEWYGRFVRAARDILSP
ncbi:beta-glucosidase [Nocardioides anomalus]|uniref:Beta-glucosidase n=1 Tax=Nocardioides anomalus TaxID=2712223 RepID=A0A6G6WLI2_9ACTN|nr:beta-glucosidase [Nocardioides anomalus]